VVATEAICFKFLAVDCVITSFMHFYTFYATNQSFFSYLPLQKKNHNKITEKKLEKASVAK